MSSDQTTHFGFSTVPKDQKAEKVRAVFQRAAKNYDLMNDLMSLGIHRFWKYFTCEMSYVRPGQRVLDLAGGSGDLTKLMSKKIGKQGEIVLADINADMLQVGRDRLINAGLASQIQYVQADAECLPFADNTFHCILMAFGLRNVTDQGGALRSMYRICKPGGKLMILEFSVPQFKNLQRLYDWYSFAIIPRLGQLVSGDAASYQYLAESIRMHPNQETLKTLIEQSGFEDCRYTNLSGGITALHTAYKY